MSDSVQSVDGDKRTGGVGIGNVDGDITKNVIAGGDVSDVRIGDVINKIVNQAPVEWPVSSGVPPKPNLVVGREELIAQLADQLLTGENPALSLEGMAGIGKTTLAVALVHHPAVEAHFKDGVLWAGLGQQPDVVSALAHWAGALRIDISELIQPEHRAQAIQAVIAKHRLLIVIDDAWDLNSAQQLRRCGADNCRYLLTTRDQTLARAFAGPLQAKSIPVLELKPATHMLKSLAPEAYAENPKAAQNLVKTVGRLPLALELLSGYLGHSRHRRTSRRRQQALEILTNPGQRLELATQRLGAQPDDPQVTLRATIALSLEDLPEETVAAFYGLGAFAPKPEHFALDAALFVTKVEEELLFDLVDRNLLEMDEEESLALHQVLSDVTHPQTSQEAVQAHRDYYLQQVDEDRRGWQRIEPIYGQVKWAWTRQLREHPNEESLLDFFWALRTYHRLRGLWADYFQLAEHGLQVAQSHEQLQDASTLLNAIGLGYSDLGEKQQALQYYNQALPMHRQVGNRAMEATTLNNIGLVYSDLGEKQQALQYYNQALPLRKQVGDKAGEATTLSNIGAVYSALGEKQQALEYFNQALPMHRQVGNRAMEATTLNNIGMVYSDLGEKQQALEYFNQALPMHRQVGNRAMEATTLNNIGMVYDALGDKQQALQYFNQALPMHRQVGNRAMEATTLNNIGMVYDALGEKQQALQYFNQGLPMHRQVGNRAGEAATRYNIAMIHANRGDLAQAKEQMTIVVALEEDIQHPDLENDRQTLAQIKVLIKQQSSD